VVIIQRGIFMAYQRDITAADEVYFDTDKLLRYTVYQGNPSTADITAGAVVPQDVSGWALAWTMRKKVNSPDPPLIHKEVGSGIAIVGIYNADPDLNTQRVEVTLEDTDTYDPDGSPPVEIRAGKYAYGLKRLDEGVETMLAEGYLQVIRAAPWE
jgi:hypothetical protein